MGAATVTIPMMRSDRVAALLGSEASCQSECPVVICWVIKRDLQQGDRISLSSLRRPRAPQQLCSVFVLEQDSLS